MRIFYRHHQRRDIARVLRSSTLSFASRSAYLRIFIIGIDLLLTLPVGTVAMAPNRGHLPFYSGWATVDSSVVPPYTPHMVLTGVGQGASLLGLLYFPHCTTPMITDIDTEYKDLPLVC